MGGGGRAAGLGGVRRGATLRASEAGVLAKGVLRALEASGQLRAVGAAHQARRVPRAVNIGIAGALLAVLNLALRFADGAVPQTLRQVTAGNGVVGGLAARCAGLEGSVPHAVVVEGAALSSGVTVNAALNTSTVFAGAHGGCRAGRPVVKLTLSGAGRLTRIPRAHR